MRDTLALRGVYRRNLPHIVTCERPLFLTFDTMNRRILSPGARTLILRHALYDHGTRIFVEVVVVMPDHVHMIFNLLHDAAGNDYALAAIMKGLKGSSARSVNKLMGTSGHVWQDESFDHIVREGERSRAKYQYVCENPVRAELVGRSDDYPWLWRSWVEGRGFQPPCTMSLHR